MRLEKLAILKKIVEEHKIKPTSSEFEKTVVSFLKEKIAQETDIKYVSDETFTRVEQAAKHFQSDMKILWTSKKVCVYLIMIFFQTWYYLKICM